MITQLGDSGGPSGHETSRSRRILRVFGGGTTNRVGGTVSAIWILIPCSFLLL